MDWLDGLTIKAKAKCVVKMERLKLLGHELRRPEGDYLRDEIYELRIGYRGMNYRILYFFHGQKVAILSHGIVKERIIPPEEIELAILRKRKFERQPARHTYTE